MVLYFARTAHFDETFEFNFTSFFESHHEDSFDK